MSNTARALEGVFGRSRGKWKMGKNAARVYQRWIVPENLRTDVPDRRKAAHLTKAAFNNIFPTLPDLDVATDGRG